MFRRRPLTRVEIESTGRNAGDKIKKKPMIEPTKCIRRKVTARFSAVGKKSPKLIILHFLDVNPKRICSVNAKTSDQVSS